MTMTMLGKARARRIAALQNKDGRTDRIERFDWMNLLRQRRRDEAGDTVPTTGLAGPPGPCTIFTAA